MPCPLPYQYAEPMGYVGDFRYLPDIVILYVIPMTDSEHSSIACYRKDSLYDPNSETPRLSALSHHRKHALSEV